MRPTIGILLVLLLSCNIMHAQETRITNADGTALTTTYCHSDTAFRIAGQPSGGFFSGCGTYQQSGNWYFSPVTAAAGIVVFPFKCYLSYIVDNDTVSEQIVIHKPVSVYPRLKDGFTCDGNFTLLAELRYAGDYLYTWQPAAPLERPDTSMTGGYIDDDESFVFTATDMTSGCTGSDTLIMERRPAAVLTVTSDTSIGAREQLLLHASGAKVYQWYPDMWLDDAHTSSPITMPQAPITYIVTGTNEYGCTDTASVAINIYEPLFIPSAFSPNGDGVNDLFRIKNFGYQKVMEFEVYNRWGQSVFSTTDGTSGWDGRYNGELAVAGSYYYLIRIGLENGTVRTMKGDVVLIR